jgi:hypothetical protein
MTTVSGRHSGESESVIRQRPWFAAVAAFAAVIGIGGVALGAQAVFTGDGSAPDPDITAPVEERTDREPPATTSTTTEPEAVAVSPTVVGDDAAHQAEKEADDEADDEAKEAAGTAEKETAAGDDADTTPPQLVVLEPADGAEMAEKVVTFRGETEPGATVTAGAYAAEVDGAGHWSIVLVLSPGANKASFTAVDAAGNSTTASIVLDYVPPTDDTAEKTTKEIADEGDDPVAVDFTANQVHGSCEEDPPYEVFWGTATPGTKVKVWSEYGSAKVYAGDSGEWEVKVPFTYAPVGEPFTVTVSSGEVVREFSFTSYVDPGPVPYTVSQVKAESDAPEPYAKFAGTAEAGTVIEATSAFGSASLVVEKSGEWWLKVPFSGQPANQPFPVVVAGAGQTQEFTFTWYQGEG